MKKILLPYGAARKIAKALSCSDTTVSLALSYRRNDQMSRKVRKVALEQYGGHEVNLTI